MIYRELFPFGLTIADLSTHVRPVAVSLSHVAARQELRAIMTALGLEDYVERRGAATPEAPDDGDDLAIPEPPKRHAMMGADAA